MSRYEVGTHQSKMSFECKDCAIRYYEKLVGNAYILDTSKNELVINSYGWK